MQGHDRAAPVVLVLGALDQARPAQLAHHEARGAEAEPDPLGQPADALSVLEQEVHQHADVTRPEAVLREHPHELARRPAGGAAALLRVDDLREQLDQLLEIVLQGAVDSLRPRCVPFAFQTF